MCDLIQFFATAGQACESGVAPVWLQGLFLAKTQIRGFACWVGILAARTCPVSPQLAAGSHQIPSDLLVLDPPMCSELGVAELLDSLKERKLSCDLFWFLLVAAAHKDSKLGDILLSCNFCEVALIC